MATSVGEYVHVETKVSGEFDSKIAELNIKNALRAMAEATLQRARMLAPMSAIKNHAGTLRTSGVIEPEKDGFEQVVQFGAGIEYARYQEFGGDGRRVVRNYTTPGTQAHYLHDAGESVAKEGIKKYL